MLFIAGVAFIVAKLEDGPETTRAASEGTPITTSTTVPRPGATVARPTTTAPPLRATVPVPVATAPARPPATSVPTPRAPASPATVVVPKLVGMRLGKATSATNGAGLSIAWPAHCDDVVASQSPAAGARVKRGSRVAVQLVPCTVPNVVGKRLEAAKDAIAAAKLRMSWPAYCDDIVVGQSPAPGTRVAPGTNVALQLAPPGNC
jgi:hypothetical protein